MVNVFDPFNDRTSRDIRNELSSALVCELGGVGCLKVMDVTRRWLSKVSNAVYLDYLHRCRKTYTRVIREIESARITDARLQAVELWNAQLFFEVHELLETVWHGSEGGERKALKGWIQAAGVFVHRQRNHLKAAEGLARRARANLRQASAHLDFIADLAPLMASLEDPASPPPKLSSESFTDNGSGREG